MTRFLIHSFPGQKKNVSEYGPSGAAAAAAAKDDDDELDLFGSDDEEDAEAEKLKEQRLAEYRAKKAASKDLT
jgi:elongation factor 1-beta